jgi:hypothetical protein
MFNWQINHSTHAWIENHRIYRIWYYLWIQHLPGSWNMSSMNKEGTILCHMVQLFYMFFQLLYFLTYLLCDFFPVIENGSIEISYYYHRTVYFTFSSSVFASCIYEFWCVCVLCVCIHTPFKHENRNRNKFWGNFHNFRSWVEVWTSRKNRPRLDIAHVPPGPDGTSKGNR